MLNGLQVNELPLFKKEWKKIRQQTKKFEDPKIRRSPEKLNSFLLVILKELCFPLLMYRLYIAFNLIFDYYIRTPIILINQLTRPGIPIRVATFVQNSTMGLKNKNIVFT